MPLASHNTARRMGACTKRMLLVLLALQFVSCARAFSMPTSTNVGAARMAFKAPIRGVSSCGWGIFNRRASSSVAAQPVLQWCPSRSSAAIGACSEGAKRAGWGIVSTWLKTGVYNTISSDHVFPQQLQGILGFPNRECPAHVPGMTF